MSPSKRAVEEYLPTLVLCEKEGGFSVTDPHRMTIPGISFIGHITVYKCLCEQPWPENQAQTRQLRMTFTVERKYQWCRMFPQGGLLAIQLIQASGLSHLYPWGSVIPAGPGSVD